jgi:hypothetical protein
MEELSRSERRAYRIRESDLLLASWNGRYFLLPVGWRENNLDTALMIKDEDLLRVEFSAACV